ncbi:hypothetical protein ABXV22_25580 [Vibrio rotiferianus]|uniref:hypothetical protein n=1 Tax=Vibrio rotiferianus TaxID=190895 RepID=UPI0033989C4D
MNKKAYYRDLIQFKNKLDSDEFLTLTDVVRIFERIHVVTSELNYVLFTHGDQNSSVQQEKIKVNDSIKQAIAADRKQTKIRKLHRCTIVIEDVVRDIITRNPSGSKISILLSGFLHSMERFLDDYEGYRIHFGHESVYALSFTAHQLLEAIKSLNLAIDAILDNYLPDTSDTEHHLELYLSHVPSLKQFGIKLQILDEMYGEICHLCDFSLIDHPIIIDHIENGSLLARISGHPLIVGIILQIIGSSATYFITNYPVKNEIVEMKETVATLDDMFELTQKLESEGYDVTQMQDSIQLTLKKMSKSVEILLSDQPTIEVNEKVFELSPEHSQKLIEETKRLELNQEA